jgi:hypothetical protein
MTGDRKGSDFSRKKSWSNSTADCCNGYKPDCDKIHDMSSVPKKH